MHALPELQNAFAEAVLGCGVISGVDETHLSAEVATAVYRNNVQVNTRNALRGAFPAVTALLGDDCFEGLAGRYLAAHPSRCGDLHELGAALPAFLATVPEFAAFPYLSDVAHLEWMQRSALTAVDAGGFDFARLCCVAEADFGELGFSLAPAVGMLQSAWPVWGIWRLARMAAEGGETEPPDMGSGECVLVYRDRGGTVCTERVSAGEFRLLAAMRDGACFADAGDLAWEVEDELDVAACLQRFVAAGVVDHWHRVAAGEE